MIKKILEKYKIKRNDPILVTNIDENPTRYKELIEKWSPYISKGYYGFDLGNLPNVWYDCIDEVLDYLKEKSEGDLQIQQIKIKFGGLRFYVTGNFVDEWHNIESMINEFYHDDLVY